tara:strand:+ start:600 stop:1352 length:753 start_codon:yes stop_codon:yes gene_type:complete
MSLGSLIQGAIGNPFGSQVSGTAFGVINDVLGPMRSKDGIARPARYEVVILPPTGGQNNPDRAGLSQGVREASLKCENIAFPGRNIDTTPDTNIYGPTREIATGFSFAELSARFQCSSDMKEKLFFESWQKQSFNSQTWSMGYYNDYIGKLQIYQLDEQNERRYGVEVWECFPKTIAQQTLDYATTDQQQKLDVTFSYRYWKNLGTEAKLPQALGDRLGDVLVNRLTTTATRQLDSAIPRVAQRLGQFFR